jgi:hypothetical protein
MVRRWSRIAVRTNAGTPVATLRFSSSAQLTPLEAPKLRPTRSMDPTTVVASCVSRLTLFCHCTPAFNPRLSPKPPPPAFAPAFPLRVVLSVCCVGTTTIRPFGATFSTTGVGLGVFARSKREAHVCLDDASCTLPRVELEIEDEQCGCFAVRCQGPVYDVSRYAAHIHSALTLDNVASLMWPRGVVLRAVGAVFISLVVGAQLDRERGPLVIAWVVKDVAVAVAVSAIGAF